MLQLARCALYFSTSENSLVSHVKFIIAEQAERRGSLLPLKCIIIALYLGVQPRSHEILFYPQTTSISAIISNLLFPNHQKDTNIFVRFRQLLLNNRY